MSTQVNKLKWLVFAIIALCLCATIVFCFVVPGVQDSVVEVSRDKASDTPRLIPSDIRNLHGRRTRIVNIGEDRKHDIGQEVVVTLKIPRANCPGLDPDALQLHYSVPNDKYFNPTLRSNPECWPKHVGTEIKVERDGSLSVDIRRQKNTALIVFAKTKLFSCFSFVRFDADKVQGLEFLRSYHLGVNVKWNSNLYRHSGLQFCICKSKNDGSICDWYFSGISNAEGDTVFWHFSSFSSYMSKNAGVKHIYVKPLIPGRHNYQVKVACPLLREKRIRFVLGGLGCITFKAIPRSSFDPRRKLLAVLTEALVDEKQGRFKAVLSSPYLCKPITATKPLCNFHNLPFGSKFKITLYDDVDRSCLSSGLASIEKVNGPIFSCPEVSCSLEFKLQPLATGCAFCNGSPLIQEKLVYRLNCRGSLGQYKPFSTGKAGFFGFLLGEVVELNEKFDLEIAHFSSNTLSSSAFFKDIILPSGYLDLGNVFLMPPDTVISGVVLDTSNKPLSGARVKLVSVPNPYIRSKSSIPVVWPFRSKYVMAASSLTKGNGEFAIPVSSGLSSYCLFCVLPGFRQCSALYFARPIQGVVVYVSQTCKLRGQLLWPKGYSGHERTAVVLTYDSPGSFFGSKRFAAKVTPNGTFEWRDLYPGRATIEFYDYSLPASVKQPWKKVSNVFLKADGDNSDIRLNGVPFLPEYRAIQLELLDSSGGPLRVRFPQYVRTGFTGDDLSGGPLVVAQWVGGNGHAKEYAQSRGRISCVVPPSLQSIIVRVNGYKNKKVDLSRFSNPIKMMPSPSVCFRLSDHLVIPHSTYKMSVRFKYLGRWISEDLQGCRTLPDYSVFFIGTKAITPLTICGKYQCQLVLASGEKGGQVNVGSGCMFIIEDTPQIHYVDISLSQDALDAAIQKLDTL